VAFEKGSERNSTGGNWHQIDVGTPQSIHEYRGLFRVRNFSPRGLVVRRSDGKIQERTGLIPDAVILRLGYRGRFWNINST